MVGAAWRTMRDLAVERAAQVDRLVAAYLGDRAGLQTISRGELAARMHAGEVVWTGFGQKTVPPAVVGRGAASAVPARTPTAVAAASNDTWNVRMPTAPPLGSSNISTVGRHGGRRRSMAHLTRANPSRGGGAKP